MKLLLLRSKIKLSYPLAILMLIGITACREKNEEGSFILTGAKIYISPFEEPINEGYIIVKDGKIERVGDIHENPFTGNLKVMDCSGMVITAGFWNSHVHFIGPGWSSSNSLVQLELQLENMLLAYGFTTVFDLASLNQGQLSDVFLLRERINNGEIKGPNILIAGLPLCPEKGTPFYVLPNRLPEFDTPENAIEHVDSQIAKGSDAVKIWSASPKQDSIITMSENIAKAIVEQAHKYGKPAFAHPTDNNGVRVALHSGVDVLTHTAPADLKPWDHTLIDSMVEKRVSLIPTISLFEWELKQIGAPIENSPLIQTSIIQLRDYSMANGDILFGTDVGYMSEYSPHKEYAYMAEAGMSFLQILESLTTAPAEKFGMSKVTGMIRNGMNADLVILDGDPDKDISNLTRVNTAFKNGESVYNSKLNTNLK